jgi:transcriptional regulator with XRE-family HTH domain
MKALRNRLEWSQEQLAEELGVHPISVSRWERGKVEIPKLAELACKWIESQEGGE